LLLESDLLYEKRALDALLADDAENAILLSGPTEAGDEVFVSTENHNLVSMSKDPSTLKGPVTGELVGISKISTDLFQVMIEISTAMFRQSLRVDYETDCLVAAGQKVPVHCPLVEDLLWTEVDDEKHHTIARDSIYPAIHARET
jgi:2-aminoethylphosphonate-pyruvate transaminase